jgi:hypothetical protein
MAKHRVDGTARWVWPVMGVLLLAGLVLAGVLAVAISAPRNGQSSAAVVKASCDRPVRVVTASSFARVLAAMTAAPQPDDCLRLEVTTADGRDAVAKVAEVDADVWIPDDGAWASRAAALGLARAPAGGAGTVLATSPLYMVAAKTTGTILQQAGGGWLGLSQLVAQRKARLVVRDPGASGDGMVGAGAVAEAVWVKQDMDASAQWLAEAKKTTRTVTGDRAATPASAGEVGLVPEYALLQHPEALRNWVALPGTDFTAMLRYTWFPRAVAVADPVRAAALDRLRGRLTGDDSAGYLRTARLRTPDQTKPVTDDDPLPTPSAKPFTVLEPHHVDHVFATWYVADRRTNLLVVVDVSGSMAAKAAGSTSTRIDLVRQGCRSVAGLLPDNSRMGLWEFGSKLDGARDYKPLLAMTALDKPHRAALGTALDQLKSQATGTGLYDTILAAYTAARDAYTGGVPNQVLVLTDGRNEADKGSMSTAQLAAALDKAADHTKPVQLSVVTFGKGADAKVIENAVKPVGGYVDNLSTASEVGAVFIHVAAGGLHH